MRETPMKIQFTALTRPAHGVRCRGLFQGLSDNHTDHVEPAGHDQGGKRQKLLESANTTVAKTKPATQASISLPASRLFV
jgi:hypothetical protein